MFLVFWLLSILSLGPQAALGSLKLNISQVTECEPVFISFRGQFNSSLQQVPLSLQILPFNSTPSLISLPSYTANSTGVNVTFLPVPVNTEFVATLTSPSGSISSVSDIFEVSAGSPQNTACLPRTTFTPSFEIQDPANLSQCEDFTVSFNGRSPPVVELFNPRGHAYPLNLTSSSNKTATYSLAAIRQSQILLNFIATDGGQNQTSPLLTVQGDAFSSTSCFPTSNHTDENTSKSKSQTGKSSGISKGTIIGLSVGLGTIALLAVPMGWLVLRERRRRRRVVSRIDFDPSRMERQPSPYLPAIKEKGPPPPPPFFGYPGYTEGQYVRDPIYVSENYSPTISDYPRTSISWEYIRRNSTESQDPVKSSEILHQSLRASIQSNNLNMLSSSNIEKMLDIAARGRASVDALGLHSPRSARSNNSFGFSPVSTPPPALRPTMSLGDRAAPDVPHNTSFFADSSVLADHSDMPLSESPESMGSLLRPESGTLSPSSPGATQKYLVAQPQRALLIGVPPVMNSQPKRSASPRTVSRENSMAKLVGLGSRRTASHGSRFSMDSSVDGRF
ncbi:hypothetical protein GGU10DRAFT_311453 [Lentinula aff. detonsa]|uniref:Mid2 domain-containing protein n=1 Tax=Lentinula aff. detonsa TaxID=2804958 RepID=A0AA38KR07_9AGAR|nr:hypothetical protein GGU10DRAFT_311453 [Lentinula aff. detonsa]